MPIVLVDSDLPVPFEVEILQDRRPDLTVEEASPGIILEELLEADVFITSNGSWEDSYLDALEAGDWVQTIGAGYDRFPVDLFEERNITFTNATGIHGPSAGEHVLALLLSFARRLHEFRDAQNDRQWNRIYGSELSGKTLTILGMGNIGEAVAVRGRAFDMDVLAVKRDVDSYDGCLERDRLYTPERTRDLLPSTDFLVVVVPLLPKTRHLVDHATLDALPESAVLVNVARGGVIDERALIDALERGAIAGACLDVFETEPLPESSPLWEYDNVVVTPHVAGVSDQYTDRFAEVFLSLYDQWQADDLLENRIV